MFNDRILWAVSLPFSSAFYKPLLSKTLFNLASKSLIHFVQTQIKTGAIKFTWLGTSLNHLV